MPDTPSVEDIEAFARNYPQVAFGLLLIPVTYGVTNKLGMSVFVGGIVAFGPAIAEGFKDAQDDDMDIMDGDIDE